MGSSLLDNETRPGQSSAAQAQDAGLVRILCVAREGAYETLHEPPTADPHGGWCGGWGLAAPGYPIRPHREERVSGRLSRYGTSLRIHCYAAQTYALRRCCNKARGLRVFDELAQERHA